MKAEACEVGGGAGREVEVGGGGGGEEHDGVVLT